MDVDLTDGSTLDARIMIPDAASTLGLKTRVRTIRQEDRDAEDLWRCLEIARADGVTPEELRDDGSLDQIAPILARELGPDGATMATITRSLNDTEATRRRTRVRALLAEVTGVTVDL
ncbi:MAG: hypothetical protein U5R31_14835 [Acidimicrobiia bacterium]|nr:hypothetical protein [Acidimicrobiia bacterium]